MKKSTINEIPGCVMWIALTLIITAIFGLIIGRII